MPFIVGIGGTTRPNSSSEKAISAVLSNVARHGAEVRLFGGVQLAALPHFAPESLERTPQQLEFVNTVRRADGFVIGTPGYHSGVSGLVKNALDLLEDLRGDNRIYFDGRAVGCVVTAGGWQACGVTLQALRGIVHAMRGWPTPIGVTFNTAATQPFGPNGEVEAGAGVLLGAMACQILDFANARRNFT
jgi:FMN reductase